MVEETLHRKLSKQFGIGKQRRSLGPTFEEEANYVITRKVPKDIAKRTKYVIDTIDKESNGVKQSIKREKRSGSILPTLYRVGLWSRGLAYFLIGATFVIGAILPFYHELSLEDVGKFLFNSGWGRILLFLIGIGLIISESIDIAYKSKTTRERIQQI